MREHQIELEARATASLRGWKIKCSQSLQLAPGQILLKLNGERTTYVGSWVSALDVRSCACAYIEYEAVTGIGVAVRPLAR